MKAVVQDRYGSADVLELRDIERPVPGPDQVLVRVKAAGVNMADWHMMAGKPTIMRLFGVGFRRPMQPIRGSDVAGVVEEVGAGVTELSVGDEVFGSADATFAEFAVTTQKRLLPKPANVPFDHAAAVRMVGDTALKALRAGGLKLDALAGQGVLVIDTAGGHSLDVLWKWLVPKGQLVIVGAEGGNAFLGLLRRSLRAAVLGPFVRYKTITLVAVETPNDLAIMRDLLASGAITVPIERTFPLARPRMRSDTLRSAALAARWLSPFPGLVP